MLKDKKVLLHNMKNIYIIFNFFLIKIVYIYRQIIIKHFEKISEKIG